MKDRGWLYMLTGADGIMGVALAVRGELAAAIRWMEEAISKRETEGYRVAADWYRMFLCEIYLEIISGKEKPPLNVLIRNALTLVIVALPEGERWGRDRKLAEALAELAEAEATYARTPIRLRDT